MADESQYRDSARSRNREHHQNEKLSEQWRRDVITALRNGYGAEDIALRNGGDADDVRAYVDKLRRLGLLPEIYNEDNWRSIGSVARGLVESTGGDA